MGKAKAVRVRFLQQPRGHARFDVDQEILNRGALGLGQHPHIELDTGDAGQQQQILGRGRQAGDPTPDGSIQRGAVLPGGHQRPHEQRVARRPGVQRLTGHARPGQQGDILPTEPSKAELEPTRTQLALVDNGAQLGRTLGVAQGGDEGHPARFERAGKVVQ